MNARGRRDERGSMVPLAAVAALVLFAVVAFSVDQGIAYAAKARQENALDAARAACMDASFALVAKNDDDPGRTVADRVARTVRDAGFRGKASVWFYEAPEASASSTERHWAIGMQLEEDSPTVFARGFGIDTLPVASYRVMTAMPYAGERVWRPAQRRCGRYDYPAGADATSWSYEALSSLDAFPAELAEAARSASRGERE
mgnify:CR=1 FL=1